MTNVGKRRSDEHRWAESAMSQVGWAAWITAAVISIALVATGCSQWTSMPREPVTLPTPPQPLDAAEFEIAFVELGNILPDQWEALWQEIDETLVPIDRRRLYQENGLRWGVVGPLIPPRCQKLLRKADAEGGEGAALREQLEWANKSGVATARRIQVRDGRSVTVVVSKPSTEPLVLLWRDEEGARGVRLEKAECQFTLTTRRLDGGQIELTLTPRVEHGEARSRVVGHEGTWMVQAERERLVLEPLTLQVQLSPGQILFVGPNLPARGAGASFFGGGTGQKPPRMLMIRLANAPTDSLFDSPAAD